MAGYERQLDASGLGIGSSNSSMNVMMQNGTQNTISASLIHPVSVAAAGSQSVFIAGSNGTVLSVSLVVAPSSTITGSQSVFIVGQADTKILSVSQAFPLSATISTIDTVGRIVGDIRATNFGIRPLTSASDTVNVPLVTTVGTVSTLTNIGQIQGDIRSTNFGIRPLTSASDTVTAVVPTVAAVTNVGQIQGDIRGTNFGIRPLTSASDSIAATQSGVWNTANVQQVIGDIKGTNFGIRPLTSASDSVTVTGTVAATVTGSQSVIIVGKVDRYIDSASVAYPVNATISGDVRATNLGIRPLTSASDSVNAVQSGTWNIGTVTSVTDIPTVDTVTTVGRIVQDVNATNFGIRKLRSDSDFVTVANVIGDIKGTNFGIRPLTSASDTVNVPTVSVVTNLGQLQGDVRGTNFGIRPLTSASDSVTAVGNVASGATDSGNPVKTGGKAHISSGSMAQVTEGQRVDTFSDLSGAQIVRHQVPYGDLRSGRVVDTAGNAAAMPGFTANAGLRNYITAVSIHNSHATTNGSVDILDGTSGSVMWTFAAPATGGSNMEFDPPLKQYTTNTGLAYDVSAAISNISISINGFQEK